MTVSATQVKYARSHGQTFTYRLIASVWQSDPDVTYKLSELRGAGDNRTGWKITKPDDGEETYSAKGDFQSIFDKIGLTQTLTYSCTTVSATCLAVTPTTIALYSGLLVKVSDNFGRSLNFTYNASGKMTTVVDPAGQIICYSYDTSGNLKTVVYPDNTPSVTTDNPKTTNLYGSDAGELVNTANVLQPNALTGIIDENGVRYATYKYDTNCKATSTEHAGSVEKYSLNYAADGASTSVTNPLGTIRTSHFTTVLGVVKSTGTDQPGGSGCAAASSAITYDANGNVASRTDFNGHKVCYTYDLARNLETERAEGLAPTADCTASLSATGLPLPARKVSTEWHPSFRLPTKVTEPGLGHHLFLFRHRNLSAKGRERPEHRCRRPDHL